jgi:hypothetical protein
MTKQLHSPFQHSIPFPTPSPHSFIHSFQHPKPHNVTPTSFSDKILLAQKNFFQNPQTKNEEINQKTKNPKKRERDFTTPFFLLETNQKKERVKGVNYRSIHSIMATLKQEITLSNNQTYDFNVKVLDLLRNSLCFLFNSLETQGKD